MAAVAFENTGSVAVLGHARCHAHELNKTWWRLGTKWICAILLELTGAHRASLEGAKPRCLPACDEKGDNNKQRVGCHLDWCIMSATNDRKFSDTVKSPVRSSSYTVTADVSHYRWKMANLLPFIINSPCSFLITPHTWVWRSVQASQPTLPSSTNSPTHRILTRIFSNVVW